MSSPRALPSLPVFLSQWLVRAFVWLVTRLFYPLRVRGLENVPRRGGVLLVSNHVSFVDWLLLTAAADRPHHSPHRDPRAANQQPHRARQGRRTRPAYQAKAAAPAR